MFDPRRLRGTLFAAASIASAVLLFSLLVQATEERTRRFCRRLTRRSTPINTSEWPGESPAPRSRSESITREANASLAVILGGSPLNTDVDPTLLDRIGGVDCRWLGLFVPAANAEDLDEMMTLFDKSNLEYHAVVLTVDRLTFAPSIKNRSDEENLELYRSGIFLFKNNWIELKNELDKVALIPVARALPGRLFVNHWVHQNMLAAKTAILMELGVPLRRCFRRISTLGRLPTGSLVRTIGPTPSSSFKRGSSAIGGCSTRTAMTRTAPMAPPEIDS